METLASGKKDASIYMCWTNKRNIISVRMGNGKLLQNVWVSLSFPNDYFDSLQSCSVLNFVFSRLYFVSHPRKGIFTHWWQSESLLQEKLGENIYDVLWWKVYVFVYFHSYVNELRSSDVPAVELKSSLPSC